MGETLSRAWSLCVVVGLTVLLSLVLAGVSNANGLEAQLADAESRAATALAQLDSAGAERESAQQDLRSAEALTKAAAAQSRSADSAVREIQTAMTATRTDAKAEIVATNSTHTEEVTEHDEAVTDGLAIALAALILAGIAFGWGWFRTNPSVAWLARMSAAQAVTLCLLGGFVVLLIGGGLIDGGQFSRVLGGSLIFLGLGLPVAFLLARHSTLIEDGRATPLLGNKRFPSWVSRAVGASMAALLAIGVGISLSAPDPKPVLISSELEEAAERDDPAEARKLAAAKLRAGVRRARLSDMRELESEAQSALDEVKSTMRSASLRANQAEGDAKRIGRRLAVVTRREAQVREREEEEALAVEESECHSSYTGACLDPGASDYDCSGGSGDGPNYTGPVGVVGPDEFDLDRDGDGYACETG